MIESAETYRGRAEQARLAARSIANPQHRALFERLARSYEALAADLDWLEGGRPAPPDGTIPLDSS
jgi:hypothetical protein